jgi:tRNA threonylcarbamoyl adenosine modification protein (Sua5/YciO/YrdC/YwlC family)
MKRLDPGPYTFILPAARMKQLPRILVSKRKTVGIRVPDHRIPRAIVESLGHPILTTSVTGGGDAHPINDLIIIQERFRNQVDIIIDGGQVVSEPSTVIDLTGESAVITRRGAGDASILQ